jgi:hypothetical protein
MQTERGKAFVDREPVLTTEEAYSAYSNGQTAESLRGIPCLGEDARIEYLAIKFALRNGQHSTILPGTDERCGSAKTNC